jgi:hypothetical protein
MTICWCRRLPVAIAVFCFLACSYSLVFAQGTKIASEYDPIADTDRDRPAEREQWFMRGRTIPGQATAALRYRAHLQKMQMRAARMSAFRNQGLAAFSQGFTAPAGWTPLGPAPLASDATGFGSQDYHWVSGRATAVAVDHADLTGNTVYVGGAYGGVWKSTNAGPLSLDPANVTWTPVIDNQATLAVGAIAVQPQLSNPDPTQSVILVGTGETNSSGDSYYGLGILRSADAGATWNLITQDSTQTRSFAGMGFSKIAFSTANPNLVVAAAGAASQGITENLENPNTVNRGIYYSTNSGSSWTYASMKDSGVTIDPGSATSVAFNSGAAKFYAAMRYHGIYSSGDGVNWVRLAVQPGAGLSVAACPAHTSASCPIYRGEISVVPGRNEMYVWYVDGNDTNQGIWKSSNGGTSWTKLTDTGITICGDPLDSCGTSQGFYNLELAAVPNGATSTDLYAGTINLYKCTITSSSPTCSGTGSNKFLNLTHVYGCAPNFGSIAHVHPDQHGIDYMVVNSQAIMYFANDGGIYRALDGYTGLTTGTCGGSNLFDSLNQTLGSMTQFVSFSQHPTDSNIILGGTQDNGSPATASAQSSTSWLNVNNGDGGYNEINPNNPTEWFTANFDVSIQKCSSGIACHAQDFSIIVDNSTVGQDVGPFYTPYILDPQNSSELLVGTCQVWRGTTTGTGFVLLSPNFETGTGSCAGNEFNMVRSLAAGGAKDANNFSNVIYAGTDGAGPLLPGGGHLWVSTNAAGGSGSWAERTGGINPSSFPISSVAIDTSDATGQTAYVTIMGFHVSHVWKTTNGGQSWSDFGAGLPDSPANAVVVDSTSNPPTIYVGTDSGVFSSSTVSPTWTEVGPPSNQPGFLPNVSVTALRLFNSGGTKRLRASTYGRGIWEFNLITTPDFQASFSNNPLTTFVGQTAVFDGMLTALNGYASRVDLSCAPPKPPTCSVSLTSWTPPPDAQFTVTASGPAADYTFNLHAVGTDPTAVTHDFPLTLHVVDFNLTAPSPSSITANRPNGSGPVNFQVTAAGSFSAAVDLSCSGLPAGAACNFQPSSTVFPTSASPVSVTLTISTTTGTPTGTFPLTINGSTSGINKTQNLSLTVTANADYTLLISNPSQSAPASSSATFNGTLTAFNGYTSAVDLSCGAGAPPTCMPSPSSVIPTSGGVAFTVVASSNLAQNYNFNIVGQGTDPSATTHSYAVTFSSTFDFSITNSSSAQSVKAGLSATYNLDAAPLGSNFPNSVTLSCTGLPARSTCSFNPAQVNSGSGDTPIVLTIATNAPIPTSAKLGGKMGLALYSLFLPSLLIFAGWKRDSLKRQIPKNRKYFSFFLVLLALPLIGLLPACGGGGGGGGGGQPGTPPGSYTVTVTARSGSLTHTASVALTVQ